jgi:hypothetical protein
MFARFLGPGMLQGYFLPQKMFSLQFVLIFSKLQGLGVRLATWAGAFPCHPYLPPPVFASREYIIYKYFILSYIFVDKLIFIFMLFLRGEPS